MAYDERLAQRVRDVLGRRAGLDERKMFGGLAFLLDGRMFCGTVNDELMVRVGPKQHEAALALPHARPMDFTGRPMKGLVYVARNGLGGRSLAAWVKRGLAGLGDAPPRSRMAARSTRRKGRRA
jgi:TfoX/Sxy family transcriptional regulator of competence genes